MSPRKKLVGLLILPILLIVVTTTRPAANANGNYQIPHEKIDPGILDSMAEYGQAEFILFLSAQADLSQAQLLTTRAEKGAFVYDKLSQVAWQSQKTIIAYLESQGAEYRSYWVANMLWVRGDQQLLEKLSARADIAHLYSNPKVNVHQPLPDVIHKQDQQLESVEWNIRQIRAPEVWAMGFTGQNVVIGGQDTGYDWTHPALQEQYRGWDGANAAHDYHWHDAIHDEGGVCGSDSQVPCDDHGHGTHTMGIMVGDDGEGRKIGVAPGARWIGCRNMDQGIGTPITYSECYEWFIAPTDLEGNNPDPLLAPHVINNSWSCPPSEGCSDPLILRTVVENVRAAGIMTVHAAGNYLGDSEYYCGTIDSPAANYDASFTVGATDEKDIITSFSRRGPSTIDGIQYIKPDVVAPGQNVTSSLRGGGYGPKNGTSMAAPHVAGLAALAISADPSLAANVDGLELFMTSTAIPLTSGVNCGGTSGTIIPNNTYGYGRIDALRTYNLLCCFKTYTPIFSVASVTSGYLKE